MAATRLLGEAADGLPLFIMLCPVFYSRLDFLIIVTALVVKGRDYNCVPATKLSVLTIMISFSGKPSSLPTFLVLLVYPAPPFEN